MAAHHHQNIPELHNQKVFFFQVTWFTMLIISGYSHYLIWPTTKWMVIKFVYVDLWQPYVILWDMHKLVPCPKNPFKLVALQGVNDYHIIDFCDFSARYMANIRTFFWKYYLLFSEENQIWYFPEVGTKGGVPSWGKISDLIFWRK